MSIHLARDGSALGVFSDVEVREGLASGRFRHDDLAWREGMPAWVALASWPEFAGVGPAPDVAAPGGGPAMPAWERGASFANFLATVRDVAIDPVRTFDSLPAEGVGKPLGFNYLAGLPGWLCGSLAYGLFFALIGSAALMGGGDRADKLSQEIAALGVGGMALVIAACFCCFFAALPLLHFAAAGLAHLLLLPWSPKGGYLATYRAIAYSQGAFTPFIFIPCLNYIASPWSVVAGVIALSRVHRVDWWKVVISAVVIPCGCFCCCYAGWVLLVFDL